MKLKATKEEGRGGSTFVTEFELIGGVSLRDYFAAKAIQGLISSTATWRDREYVPSHELNQIENEARLAYQIADAMLAERNKGREEE